MRKRLVKSRRKWFFVVASGLAEYFGIPPSLVRVALAITTFLSILGVVAYLILAIWMPKPSSGDN